MPMRIAGAAIASLLAASAACDAGPRAGAGGSLAQSVTPVAAHASAVETPATAPGTEPGSRAARAEPAQSAGERSSDAADAAVAAPPPAATTPPPADRRDSADAELPAPRFPRPKNVRGLYVNAWAAGSAKRMQTLLGIARRTEVNSFVIDIKDASGYVSHRTEVPLAHEIGASDDVRIDDLPALLDTLQAEGIYPIARIVIVRDPILATYRPELAVNDTAGGVWIDGKGLTWLNLNAKGVWDYHVALAREVAKLGFPEIQFDYVRFPDAPPEDLDRAVFPGADGRPKTEVIRGFLQYAKSQLADLGVQLTADVFGVTTSATRDVGIGQKWESFIDVVDVAQPMVYPSHYWQGSFGYEVPNAHPYEIVRRALRDAMRRSAEVPGAGRTRPWLQDFSLGKPIYAAAEVRAQIQATYDAGITEWILWNPGSRYTEAALEPVDGFEREPYIRVAGVLTPVSRRLIVLDSVAALPPPPPSPAADSLVAEPADNQ